MTRKFTAPTYYLHAIQDWAATAPESLLKYIECRAARRNPHLTDDWSAGDVLTAEYDAVVAAVRSYGATIKGQTAYMVQGAQSEFDLGTRGQAAVFWYLVHNELTDESLRMSA